MMCRAAAKSFCGLAIIFVVLFHLPGQLAVAQDKQGISEALVKRIAAEKAARRACKVKLCKAFQSPTTDDISCDVTKTWLRQDILGRIVGGSYVWAYGHTQCSFKLAVDGAPLSDALKKGAATLSLKEHQLTCNVSNKKPEEGKAFSVKVSLSPKITFSEGKATGVALSSIKTEGSSLASAAVGSAMALDKVSGLVSKGIAKEVNEFLYSNCKDEGIDVAVK